MSETLLAGLICVPVVLILEIVVLGKVPFGRPLEYLLVVNLVIAVLSLLLTWRYRGAFKSIIHQSWLGTCNCWNETTWIQRLTFLLGIFIQLAATCYGAWNSPWSVDELSYQIPQAIQPYQDGRLGPVQANVIWADSYPRAVALLYYWTLQLTHSDVGFHPVNGAFGFIFILATYVAARRTGLGIGWALMAAGIVPTAPVFAYLNTIGYIDMSVGGISAAALAMALPERSRGWSWGSCISCFICCVLALWMKFTTIALISVIVVYRIILIIDATLQKLIKQKTIEINPRLPNFLLLSVFMLILAFVPYIRTWQKYGSPVYPIRLKVGNHVIFNGPIDTALFGRMNDRPFYERFVVYWVDWDEKLTTDSPGSFGPLFAIGMLVPTIVCLIMALYYVHRSWLLLVVVFWMVLLLPEFHVPRYALYILLPGALSAVWIGQSLHPRILSFSWCCVLLLLAIYNSSIFGVEIINAVKWQQSFNISLLTENRNRPIVDKVVSFNERTPAPSTRQALYKIMKPGETLIGAVHGYQTLLHDPRYQYRVEHRPAKPWPHLP
ncbi:MAG: hypothetical protein JSV03_08815, partial [Planctomycetota bacterium]